NSGTAKPEAAYTDQLSTNFEREHASDSLLYSVSVVNSYGKTAGPSNQVSIPAAPTLRPPHNFKAEIEADGVKLSWEPVLAPSISNLRFVYRVYRRESEAGPETIVGDLPLDRPGPPAMVDRSFDWEKTYQYGVRVVTVIATGARVDEQVDGEDSEPKRLSTNDVFPPATPTGLQAVFSASANKASIDLVWTPNSEADLAGYNVYRREPDKPFVKLNQEVVRASAYRDPDITLGKQYFYSVSALDVRDNESPRSEEASESTPAP
ncbi:MAG: fibronectin type III domain-containing protein, partial [Acidobacteria bacterium]|nr:fibronectin type III domain-containing protein [Acidobacteriota bacterium]